MGYSTPQFVSNMERGISSVPPRHTKKLAKVLGVEAELLGEAIIQEVVKKLKKEMGL